MQLYFDVFASGDTEERNDGPSPATLVGLGFRMFRQKRPRPDGAREGKFGIVKS